MADHGTFYWNELMTKDADAAKAFYGESLGWTFDAMDMDGGGTYWLCKAGDRPAGGIFPMAGPDFENVPPHWMSYVAVDDVDARVETAKTKGGALMRPVFDVPGIGRIAIVQDPEGVVMGWMTPASESWPAIDDYAGGAGAWIDLASRRSRLKV